MFLRYANPQELIKNTSIQLIVSGLTGVALGALMTFFPPKLVLLGTIALLLLPMLVRRPDILIVVIFLALSTIIDADLLPAIPGYESVKLIDLIFAGLIGMVIVRALGERDFSLLCTPLNIPLLLFFGFAMISTTLAIFKGNVEVWQAFEEVRILAYYLIFFVVINLVRNEKQLLTLINGLFVLATLVATLMILQFLLGDSVAILPGRVEHLATQGSVFSNVTRILPPGQSVILVSSITISVIIVLRRFRMSNILLFVLWGFITLAVVLTFNRSFWMGTGLGMGILATQVRGSSWKRYVAWGFVVVATVLVIFGLLSTQPESQLSALASASAQRFLTVFTGGGATEDASFQWRYPEYEHGLPTFLHNPILGIGLGAAYRPYDSRIDQPNFILTRYTHNGHLWIAMKTGIVGYGLWMLTLTIFIWRGFQNWRQVNNPFFAGVLLGFSLATISILVANIVAPIFMQWYWTPILGAMMGINEVVIHNYAKPESADSPQTVDADLS